MENKETDSTRMMRGCMTGCMKACRWCPFMPIIFGVALFLLGYYLDAEAVRLLWLVFSGFMVLMGLMMLVMVNVFLRGE